MKKIITIISVLTLSISSIAQVGIGTVNPEGALDVNSNDANTLGMVIPRVPDYSVVTSVSGSTPVNGTIVYDTTLEQLMFYVDNAWITLGRNATGDAADIGVIIPPPTFANSQPPTYIKSSNTGINDRFGYSISLSADGSTMVVGTRNEDSNAIGINGNQADNSASDSGAVYVYARSGSSWSQQAYIKASNTLSGSFFGQGLSLSADGSTLAVGAPRDRSNATGVNGNQNDTSAPFSGAVYMFTRSGVTWSQQAYIKASNTGSGDVFAIELSLSADGTTLAVGATSEDSSSTGINGNQTNDSSINFDSGAVYIFSYNGSTWNQEAYVKASNTDSGDKFGTSLSLSADGSTLAVGANSEDSNVTGINGNQNDDSAGGSGAVYIYTRSGTIWSQQAYIKASNTKSGDVFGSKLVLNSDGNILAVSALGEDSNATGINGNQNDDSASSSGAVYIYTRSGNIWSQQVYIKASNTDSNDSFGASLSISADGNTLAIGANAEDSDSTEINGNQNNVNSTYNSGAVYIYKYNGSNWSQLAYIKASNTGFSDFFGSAVGLSGDGTYLGVLAFGESSSATGINGNQNDNSFSNSGAAYVYKAE